MEGVLIEELRPWDPALIRKGLTLVRVKGWRARHATRGPESSRYPVYVGSLVKDLEPILAEFLLALEQLDGRLSQIEAKLITEI